MRHLLPVLATGALALAVGCQKTDGSVADRLDRIDKRMATMEKQLTAIAARGGAQAGKAQRPKRPRPKPELTYSVPIDGVPIVGLASAPVTIVEGYEFACGWCEKTRPLVKEIVSEYGGKVRLAHKSFLIFPDVSTNPALAACAADKQGKFSEFEELVWKKAYKTKAYDKPNLITLAKEAGADARRFESDMNGRECAEQLKRDRKELSAVGVTGTPSFFINGRWLTRERSDEKTKENFRKLINEELKKAEKRIAEGTPAETYYAEWVVKKGMKKL